MTYRNRILSAAAALLLCVAVLGSSTPDGGPLRFRVSFPGDAPQGVRGRLLVFMTDQAGKRDVLTTGFVPGDVAVAGAELDYLAPGESCGLDPDRKAFPRPFSQYGKGRYQFMALLDTDHSFAYSGLGPGDLYSPVVVEEGLDPAETPPVELILSRTEPPRPRPDTPQVRLAEFRSPLLSAFWGRPIVMRAGVVLPGKASGRLYPAVYHVHGFGGNHLDAWDQAPSLTAMMRAGTRARMAHVFLDGSFPSGHHEFADSVNNGPWGKALTTEFIPWLEKNYPLEPSPKARFLTGHSSGGWSTLWLQITYPDFFGGTWSTSPDPVDMRSFTGVDVTPGSRDNMYRKADGSARNLVREGGREVASIESFAREEEVVGPYGGQLASFEWVFSARGPDGRPMRLFNRVTGEQDPVAQESWRHYDIRFTLATHWATLGPKLQGKLHIICGSEDTFHLEEAVVLLCGFLKEQGSDATCELVPGRDHMNLYASSPAYPRGLEARIDREMNATYRSSQRRTKAPAN